MEFEWDAGKDKENQRKHGVTFRMAARVFDDPHRIERFDAKHSDDEDRYVTIGYAERILFVVYAEREDGGVVRIISARRANNRERGEYYDGYDVF